MTEKQMPTATGTDWELTNIGDGRCKPKMYIIYREVGQM